MGFLFNVFRKKWVVKLIFCMEINMKGSCIFILWFLMGMVMNYQSSQNSKFAIQYFYNVFTMFKKRSWDEVDFFCLQINIKVSYKLISALWSSRFPARWYYHYWWAWSRIILSNTQSDKCVISLQYLKKEVRDRAHFVHTDQHQSFYKLTLLFLMEKSHTWPKYTKQEVGNIFAIS